MEDLTPKATRTTTSKLRTLQKIIFGESSHDLLCYVTYVLCNKCTIDTINVYVRCVSVVMILIVKIGRAHV